MCLIKFEIKNISNYKLIKRIYFMFQVIDPRMAINIDNALTSIAKFYCTI